MKRNWYNGEEKVIDELVRAMSGPMIAVVIIIAIGVVSLFIWNATANIRKSKKAEERFENDKVIQKTNIIKISESKKSWIPSDIKRGQGRRVTDAASSSFGDNIDEIGGIYCFYISSVDYDGDDFFIPAYVGKTTNFRKRWMQHIKKIDDAYYYENNNVRTEIKYQKIANYLHHTGLKPNDLRFVVLEIISHSEYQSVSKKREEFYIKETGCGERGFNSVKA